MGDIDLAVLLLGNGRGKRSKIGKWYSARATNEGLEDTKKPKAMTNVNMKSYVKIYVGDSHNKKKKNTPITGPPLQEKAPTFYKDFSEKHLR